MGSIRLALFMSSSFSLMNIDLQPKEEEDPLLIPYTSEEKGTKSVNQTLGCNNAVCVGLISYELGIFSCIKLINRTIISGVYYYYYYWKFK